MSTPGPATAKTSSPPAAPAPPTSSSSNPPKNPRSLSGYAHLLNSPSRDRYSPERRRRPPARNCNLPLSYPPLPRLPPSTVPGLSLRPFLLFHFLSFSPVFVTYPFRYHFSSRVGKHANQCHLALFDELPPPLLPNSPARRSPLTARLLSEPPAPGSLLTARLHSVPLTPSPYGPPGPIRLPSVNSVPANPFPCHSYGKTGGWGSNQILIIRGLP